MLVELHDLVDEMLKLPELLWDVGSIVELLDILEDVG
jgi:hypothetical protein